MGDAKKRKMMAAKGLSQKAATSNHSWARQLREIPFTADAADIESAALKRHSGALGAF